MPENTAKISDSDFIKVTDVINAVDSKATSVRKEKHDLLDLVTTMKDTVGNVIEGLAGLLSKLPTLNMSKIGKVELQSTYFEVFLSEVIADQDQQVALWWASKSVDEDLTICVQTPSSRCLCSINSSVLLESLKLRLAMYPLQSNQSIWTFFD